MTTAKKKRDGFVIYERGEDDKPDREIDFIACTKNGRMREKVETGLLMKVDFDHFYFRDTREED